MAEAYIVDAVRAPVGRRGGGLSGVHPADLGAHVLTALMDRTGIDPAAVEDVVFGCVDAVGPQAGDIARTCWLAAGLPEEVPGFNGAEMIARDWDISRAEMEAFAHESHRRAVRAIDEGRFARETVPYEGVTADEGPRRDTSPEKMAALRTLVDGGRLTAALSSQISDGAAALLIASEQAVQDHGLTARARVHHLSARGEDPVRMLSAPIPATAYAYKKSGLTMDDIDTAEINEAFASVVLAWLKETGADPARVNPNGGAIALGHPLGATGARLMTTLLHELERTGGRYGLQTMCEGGGQANTTILERL
ncbi:acetyl-CoA C-acyltransferase [Spirillospora sp. NBC_00431]